MKKTVWVCTDYLRIKKYKIMTNTEILNQALDAYEKENDLFDRKKFDDIQILSVVFKAMDLVNNLNIPVVSQQRELLFAWEQYKKANWYESDAVDVEKMLMSQFLAIYSG